MRSTKCLLTFVAIRPLHCFKRWIDLEFRDEALDAIAKKAMARKTGARGLRSIVEAALLDTMYDLPSMEDVEKVVIDESVIDGQSKPLLIYGKPEAQQASGE